MNNSAKPASQPVIVVFGVTAIGKPKAGKFKGTDVPAARKAATKLGLSVIDVADEAGLALAAKLPAGRIGGSGETIIPFVNKDLHTQIKALEGRSQKNGQGNTNVELVTATDPKSPHLPRSWDDIKVGDRVLAQETDPADGWWQVTIIEANGDLLKLRWPGNLRGRPLQKHRAVVGLSVQTRIKPTAKTQPSLTQNNLPVSQSTQPIGPHSPSTKPSSPRKTVQWSNGGKPRSSRPTRMSSPCNGVTTRTCRKSCGAVRASA